MATMMIAKTGMTGMTGMTGTIATTIEKEPDRAEHPAPPGRKITRLGRDLGFLLGQRLGDGREMGGKIGVLGLRGQRLGPVAGEPVVAVAVVGLADLALGRVVIVEIALRGRLDRLAQHARLGVALGIGEELEAFAKRAELAQ
jgi:hypothetical protein